MATTKTWAAFSDELAAIAEDTSFSVAAIQAGSRHSASGVFWRNDVLITADHMIREEEEITAVLSPETRVQGTVIGRDPATDLAAIRLASAEGKPANFGGASELKVGNYVLALGRSRRGNRVASGGIISGLMGSWRTWQGSEIEQFIRPDLVLYPGFSGSALLNAKGQVVGINTAGLRRGTPITIPHTTIARIAEELTSKGSVARPYLGIAVRPVQLSQRVREEVGLGTPNGVLVMHVESDGPADRAGVLVGDILVRAGGESTADSEDLFELLSKKRLGEEMETFVVRGGKLVTLQVKLNERP
jgi:serine protease DegQ